MAARKDLLKAQAFVQQRLVSALVDREPDSQVPPLRRLSLGLFVSILVGALVAVVGGVGFVGLIVPHLARLMVGARHRCVLPVAALMGALFMVWVDVAARVMAPPMEVPLSVVTGLIGAPVFLLLLGRRHYHFGGAG